jgi:UDP-GlcNAc:undecaprenyl-phosphate/decaprenyl-phosphate GlcNAc-1-phosphate transferase
MDSIIMGGLLSFVITFYALPVIILVANHKKLYDLPGERKIHASPIPSLGGLGIFIGFAMGLLLTLNIADVGSNLQFYLAAFLVVFFFGVKDDVLNLVPMKKLMGQLMVAIILMFKANLLISDMYGFLFIHKIPTSISYILTLTTIIVVMNAFNLIDGVDGLAGTLGAISSSLFGLFFYLHGDMFYALMGFTLTASLVAFLIYNYSPARIFMGDTGSMLIGLVNAILVIRFIELSNTSGIIPPLTSPAMGFGILLIPLLDTLRVFAIRILHGRSPFSPDRNHLHHLLLDRGFSHLQITITLSVAAFAISAITYFSLNFGGATKVIFAQIFLFFLAIYFVSRSKAKYQKLVAIKGDVEETTHNDVTTVNVQIKKVRSFVSLVRNVKFKEEEQN